MSREFIAVVGNQRVGCVSQGAAPAVGRNADRFGGGLSQSSKLRQAQAVRDEAESSSLAASAMGSIGLPVAGAVTPSDLGRRLLNTNTPRDLAPALTARAVALAIRLLATEMAPPIATGAHAGIDKRVDGLMAAGDSVIELIVLLRHRLDLPGTVVTLTSGAPQQNCNLLFLLATVHQDVKLVTLLLNEVCSFSLAPLCLGELSKVLILPRLAHSR